VCCSSTGQLLTIGVVMCCSSTGQLLTIGVSVLQLYRSALNYGSNSRWRWNNDLRVTCLPSNNRLISEQECTVMFTLGSE
jgi:hypothetical protein